MSSEKFIIQPHFRLQEWVAQEKGYFAAEGLEYEFQETVRSSDGGAHDLGGKRAGAYQNIEEGRTASVSCACHWTVNIAAAKGHGKLWADVYSVAPAGIFVPPDSPVKRPEDLAGVPISVGYQSGSHYSTLQGLEPFLAAEQITLSFGEGMLFKRLDNLLQGRSQASALFSGPYYLAEQLGYHKLLDTTFMIASLVTGEPAVADLQKFQRALKRAQRDIDLRPDLYTHYYRNEFPERYHELMDTRRWGPGERIVFEPYTAAAFDEAQEWIARREIFADDVRGVGGYADATIRIA